MAVRTPAQAVAWASAPRRGYGGLCLQFVRLAYGVGPKYGYARLAWQKARWRHATSSWAQVPIGAPIYLDRPSSKYGHIAIYVGGGRMATTNASTNRTSVTPISTWTGSYGYRMLGWSEDVNGVRVVPTGGGVKISRYRVTAKQGVNVRTKPSTSAKVTKALPKGSIFTVPKGSGTVKGSGHRWFKTTAGHYVAADYVERLS